LKVLLAGKKAQKAQTQPHVRKHHKEETQWIKITDRKRAIVGIIIFGGLLVPLFLLVGLNLAASIGESTIT